MKRHFLLVFWLMTVSLDAMDIRVPSDLLVSLMGLNPKNHAVEVLPFFVKPLNVL